MYFEYDNMVFLSLEMNMEHIKDLQDSLLCTKSTI